MNVSASTALNLAVALTSILIAILELVTRRARSGGIQHALAAFIAAGVALYAITCGIHTEFGTADNVLVLARVEYALIALLVGCIVSYAAVRTNYHPTWTRWWLATAAAIILLILGTDLVVSSEVRFQSLTLVDHPYPQPMDTPFTGILGAYMGGLAIWAVLRVWYHRPAIPERWAYCAGVLLWGCAAAFDSAMLTGDFTAPAYMMESAFVFFSLAILYAHSKEHVQLLAESEDVRAILLGQRDEAKADLSLADQVSRSVVECVDEGIVVLDSAGRILLWNSFMVRWSGREEEDVRLHLLGEVLPLVEEELLQIGDAVDRALAGEPATTRDLRATRGESVVWFEGQTLPHLRDDGTLAGAVVVLRDVTRERQLSARIAAVDRMVTFGTMAAGIGHEINNPLSWLLLNLRFLEGHIESGTVGADSERLRTALDEAKEGGRRIQATVAQLQLMANSTAEQPNRALDIQQPIDWAVRTTAHAVGHRARLVLDLQAVPEIVGDEGQLGQVLVNLLSNAAHSIPVGRVDDNEIRVSTRPAENGLVLEITDTGSGIESANLERIFDPFFTTKEQGRGTGLGLPICQRIIEDHGGRLEVDSELGVGSVFRIWLPAAPPGRRTAQEPSAATVQPTRALRVALVDDELSLLRALARMLSCYGIDIDATQSPGELLAWLAEGRRFDAVICDLMIPEMSGMDLYERIRGDAPELAERVVFITGGTFSPEIRAFAEEHRHRCLKKPFEDAELVALLQQRSGP